MDSSGQSLKCSYLVTRRFKLTASMTRRPGEVFHDSQASDPGRSLNFSLNFRRAFRAVFSRQPFRIVHLSNHPSATNLLKRPFNYQITGRLSAVPNPRLHGLCDLPALYHEAGHREQQRNVVRLLLILLPRAIR